MLPNPQVFKTQVPELSPLSPLYAAFWGEELRRCVEGYWSAGVWMPPFTYFYINHWHIKVGRAKTPSLPTLRDLEWEKGWIFEEARGFSGFEGDARFHCLREAKDAPDARGRLYKPAREYLRDASPREGAAMGAALYGNPARNVIEMGARGYGKSYWCAGMAAWTFLFDGAQSVEELLRRAPSSETVLCAQASDFISPLVGHFKFGLDRLLGGVMVGTRFHPPPFHKEYSGSLQTNKHIIQEEQFKRGNTWMRRGSTSKVHVRVIGDDSFVTNGTRSRLVIVDETGFVPLLPEVFSSCKFSTQDDDFKFGVIWATGTGGEMEGRGAEASREVFFDPDTYDCLSFRDEWEETGRIGYFVPAYMGLNNYKDECGNTDSEAALASLLEVREKLSKGKKATALYAETMNRPIVPSEVFFEKAGGLFPAAEVKARLREVEAAGEDPLVRGVRGRMGWDALSGKASFQPDPSLREVVYPVRASNDNTGCVVVWEAPKDMPWGVYIAGIDPYAQDESDESVSVGACYVMRRQVPGHSAGDRIVARYVGRPSTLAEFMEQCRRLLLHYNALALYENNYNHLKMYFEMKGCLKLLANTPTVFKASSNESRVLYGLRMTGAVKPEAELYLRNWLLEDAPELGEADKGQKDGDGTMQMLPNLSGIGDVHLLKELLAYGKGNYDCVIALMLCNVQRIAMLKLVIREKQRITDRFFTRNLFR